MIKKTILFAFNKTIPVLVGYLFLGVAFGLLLQRAGFGALWALFISIFVYAGSMQFVLVSMLSGGIGLLSAAVMTFTVNSRHLFYGISFIEKFKALKKIRPYLVFALTDETYSLLCSLQVPQGIDEKKAYFFISLFDQLYWIIGSVLGALTGELLKFNTQGVDFAMTALFTVIFTEQWISAKSRLPAIIGLICGAVFYLILGADKFVLPSLVCACALLMIFRPKIEEKEEARA